jgi:hypothetical protein
MKHILMGASLILGISSAAMGRSDADSSKNTRQYYSGMVGFYSPSGGLNNGLLLGVDGITEFLHYNFFLSASVDAYFKQTISIFSDPQPGGGKPPDVSDQQVVLLPIHLNFGYKLAEVNDADTRFYAGAGAGYYLYFFNATFTSSSGGLLGGGLTSESDSKNGGAFFACLFARAVINKVFVEPRYYFAKESVDKLGSNEFAINPSGFAISLGLQYH